MGVVHLLCLEGLRTVEVIIAFGIRQDNLCGGTIHDDVTDIRSRSIPSVGDIYQHVRVQLVAKGVGRHSLVTVPDDGSQLRAVC